MLLLSRCEQERIQFPGLGISIEVRRLTRSRVTLGIDAPKEIRIIREEMLPDFTEQFSSQTLDETVRSHLVSTLEDQIDLAMEKLSVAQAELASGNSEDALFALSQALTGLHSIRVGESPVEQASNGKRSALKTADLHEVAHGSATSVAEPASEYHCDGQVTATGGRAAIDDSRENPIRLLIVDPSQSLINVAMSEQEFTTTTVSGTIPALYEMSRAECPEVVIVAATQDADKTDATVGLLNRCGQGRATKVFSVDPPSVRLASVESKADIDAVYHAFADSIALRVRQEVGATPQRAEW